MENFHDPLDALIEKHISAIEPSQIGSNNADDENQTVKEEINYGDNDINDEIAAEEAAAAKLREEAIAKAKSEKDNTNVLMPPDPHDEKATTEDVNYQIDKLAVVTTMVNHVVAKYHLVNGGIPEAPDMERGYFGKRAVMGDLIEYYDTHSDNTITPEFENIILSNWVMDDGSLAKDWINIPHDETSESSDDTEKEPTETVEKSVEDVIPKININVPESSEVVVNIDQDVVNEMSTTKKVDVVVTKVSEEELKCANIIENSQREGIIEMYDSGLCDTPVTLPASAYRCVMGPVNWFDFIRLVAPSSGNRSDDELKKWSVLYKHMKNVSIGNFKDFDDFLKKTKYQDRELLMWAVLVATADEEETITYQCRNNKCKCKFDMKYRPRTIIHLDEEHIPEYYNAVHEASVGDEAFKLFNQVSGNTVRYELPHTKINVEINQPSAYDFITNKLKLVEDLYKRFVPEGNMADLDPEAPEMVEFDYLSANALYISSMIIKKDNKEYKYTNWSDIEDIIKLSLDTDDSAILLKIIQKSRANTSPVSFYIENVECPKCHLVEKIIPVNDIANTLLFRVSQRLDNIEINLKEKQ